MPPRNLLRKRSTRYTNQAQERLPHFMDAVAIESEYDFTWSQSSRRRAGEIDILCSETMC